MWKLCLYFGRYSEEKGISNLVKAAKKLSNIPFVFAGKGELENEVNSADNIKNVGFKTGDELRNIIEKALFTVLPAEWSENCPFSVMDNILEENSRKINDCFGVQERHRYNVYAANKKFNTDTQKGFARNFKWLFLRIQ